MITLSNPLSVNSVLGGSDMVSYDKLVLTRITYNVETMKIDAIVRITSTAQPDMQPIRGSLVIDTAAAKLAIEVPQFDFYRQKPLTGPQNTAVQGFITNAQDTLESGLISVNVIDGTQAAGS